jgi:outer membrane protein OmpA-like peptidoglycan-associated protein
MNNTHKARALGLALALTAAVGCAQTKNVAQGVKIVGDHIELADHIHFETGKADIKAESHKLLDDLAMVLKHNDDIATVHIHGHTDNSGDPAFNKTLSEQRAAAVKAYLEGKGVTKSLDAQGFGQDQPICEEDSETCRAKNRRVEFIIERG